MSEDGYTYPIEVIRARNEERARLHAEIEALKAERDALRSAAQGVIEDCEAVGVEPFHLQILRNILTGGA